MAGSEEAGAGVLCVGVAVQDFVFGLDAMPDRPQKYRARDFAAVGGGCASNSAAAVARLGGRALLAGRLGDDEIGSMILAGLAADGVDCSLLKRFAGKRSSLSAVLVDATGERMIVNYRDTGLPQASGGVLPESLPAGIGAVLADTRWAGGAAAAMRLAGAAGVPGVLDAEPPIAEVADALPLASHIVFSAQGLADLTGLADPAAGLLAARSLVPGFLAVTDGAAGTILFHGDRLARVPTLAITAVDTLGAGDVWHGAFALRLAEGADVVDAIRFANVAAALKCTRFGGRAGTPDRAETEAALASADLRLTPLP